MPVSPRETVLCRYRYDPLDRLADCALSAQADIQRFYCKSRLATEIQGAVQASIFQHEDQLLAQLQRQDGKVDTTLLATDQQRSVLHALNAIAYTPYGHRPPENGLLSLLGFNGERPDPVTGHYLLGNGYRQFNPVLMRFNSPDSWSPFGEGGLNAYGYCGGDPVNRGDPTGHGSLLQKVLQLLGARSRPAPLLKAAPPLPPRGPLRGTSPLPPEPPSRLTKPAPSFPEGSFMAGDDIVYIPLRGEKDHMYSISASKMGLSANQLIEQGVHVPVASLPANRGQEQVNHGFVPDIEESNFNIRQ